LPALLKFYNGSFGGVSLTLSFSI
jgi:hypothetical protein